MATVREALEVIFIHLVRDFVSFNVTLEQAWPTFFFFYQCRLHPSPGHALKKKKVIFTNLLAAKYTEVY